MRFVGFRDERWGDTDRSYLPSADQPNIRAVEQCWGQCASGAKPPLFLPMLASASGQARHVGARATWADPAASRLTVIVDRFVRRQPDPGASRNVLNLLGDFPAPLTEPTLDDERLGEHVRSLDDDAGLALAAT
jgi:hypothetical protein